MLKATPILIIVLFLFIGTLIVYSSSADRADELYSKDGNRTVNSVKLLDILFFFVAIVAVIVIFLRGLTYLATYRETHTLA